MSITKAELKAMTDDKFNQFMVDKMVSEGKASSITPSHMASVIFEGGYGPVSYGPINDAPIKNRVKSWGGSPVSPKKGTGIGGEGTSKKSNESMWTDRTECPEIFVVMYKDTKGNPKVKLNINNPDLVNLFVNLDDKKYQREMDAALDEIFKFCEPIAFYLCKCPPNDPTGVEDVLHENNENYFLDMAFRQWYSSSPIITKMVGKLQEMQKELRSL